jgi:hypothetical protein
MTAWANVEYVLFVCVCVCVCVRVSTKNNGSKKVEEDHTLFIVRCLCPLDLGRMMMMSDTSARVTSGLNVSIGGTDRQTDRLTDRLTHTGDGTKEKRLVASVSQNDMTRTTTTKTDGWKVLDSR